LVQGLSGDLIPPRDHAQRQPGGLLLLLAQDGQRDGLPHLGLIENIGDQVNDLDPAEL